MKRKVIRWEMYQPPPEWFPTLECGHKYPTYDGGLSANNKEASDEAGGTIDCVDCGRIEAKLKALEEEAAKLRAVLSSGGEK